VESHYLNLFNKEEWMLVKNAHWRQEPDLEWRQCCNLASHHHILHKKWTYDDGNDWGSMILYLSKPGNPPVDQLACPESLLLERQQQRHGCMLTP
jgi:hypothetical protein